MTDPAIEPVFCADATLDVASTSVSTVPSRALHVDIADILALRVPDLLRAEPHGGEAGSADALESCWYMATPGWLGCRAGAEIRNESSELNRSINGEIAGISLPVGYGEHAQCAVA
jgi:hypothetical protein